MSWETESDERYGKKWSSISRDARTSCPVCCKCLKRPSYVVHHVRYVDSNRQLLLDRVKPGIDIFPLCKLCHKEVHAKRNYKMHKNKNLNRNTVKIISLLKFGWRLLTKT